VCVFDLFWAVLGLFNWCHESYGMCNQNYVKNRNIKLNAKYVKSILCEENMDGNTVGRRKDKKYSH